MQFRVHFMTTLQVINTINVQFDIYSKISCFCRGQSIAWLLKVILFGKKIGAGQKRMQKQMCENQSFLFLFYFGMK